MPCPSQQSPGPAELLQKFHPDVARRHCQYNKKFQQLQLVGWVRVLRFRDALVYSHEVGWPSGFSWLVDCSDSSEDRPGQAWFSGRSHPNVVISEFMGYLPPVNQSQAVDFAASGVRLAEDNIMSSQRFKQTTRGCGSQSPFNDRC